MRDRHANLFYTYNSDSELIENNLTRAFILTLRHAGAESRNRILTALLSSSPGSSEIPDFSDAQFALQSHVRRSVVCAAPLKFILTLSSDLPLAAVDDQVDPSQPLAHHSRGRLGSVPDGWIFKPREYTVLIEAKIGSNPVDLSQVAAHGREWLELDRGQVAHALVAARWEQVCNEVSDASALAGRFEKEVLEEFRDYLRLCGYRTFRGFSFSGLTDPPTIQVRTMLQPLRGIPPKPQFCLTSASEG